MVDEAFAFFYLLFFAQTQTAAKNKTMAKIRKIEKATVPALGSFSLLKVYSALL